MRNHMRTEDRIFLWTALRFLLWVLPTAAMGVIIVNTPIRDRGFMTCFLIGACCGALFSTISRMLVLRRILAKKLSQED